MIAADRRSSDREALVDGLHLRNPRVASAMRAVRRHEFVPAELAAIAYVDEPVPLGQGDATASAPHMVAMMLEEADLLEGERALEVGGGMGYLAAVAAELVGPSGHIFTTEVERGLAQEAERRLSAHGYGARVTTLSQDGSSGLPEEAPFDAILVSCAAPEVLPAWKEQLREGGRLIAPIGSRFEQVLVTFTRRGASGTMAWGPACRFVPLRRPPVPHI